MSATLLPNGKQQFIDIDGKPLVNGYVYFYVPTTTMPKDTWQNAAKSILNTNPVRTDSRGQATIYGDGTYRQVLKDSLSNTIWDQETTSFPAIPTTAAYTTTITIDVDGFGATPSTGVATSRIISFAGTITDWYLVGDQTGSLVVDIWKKQFATNSPPDNSNSITASAPPTLTSQQQIKSTALSGWTTSLAVGDELLFNIDSVTAVTQFTLSLTVTQTLTLA
jgi:hypothetical protein